MSPHGVGRLITTRTFDAQRGVEHGRGLLLTSPSMEGAAADAPPPRGLPGFPAGGRPVGW